MLWVVVGGCWRWLWVPGVARCLTLTGADDECDLRQAQEVTNSRESQHPAVKVSIFKAHQQQWESCGTARPPKHWRRGSPSFSSWGIERRSERRGWIHALAAVNSAKPRNVNLSGSLNQRWGFNLVTSCTHVWFLFGFGRVYFGSHHFPAAETALKSRTI